MCSSLPGRKNEKNTANNFGSCSRFETTRPTSTQLTKNKMKFFAALMLLGGAAADRVTMETDVLVAESYTNWVGTELAADVKSANTMNVYFMMKHDANDLAVLEKTLYAVSDPDSADYGKHLSLEEVRPSARLCIVLHCVIVTSGAEIDYVADPATECVLPPLAFL